MPLYKNVASQKIAVYAHDTAADEPKTGDAGNITAQISIDGGATAATDDANPTELDAADAKGIYIFDMTQPETNGDLIIVSAVSGTADIQIEPVIIYTSEAMRGTDGANTTTPPTKAEMDTGHGLLATGAGLTTHDNKLAPVALDGGDATIGGMLTKMADDNNGADFDAGTDSLQEIRDRGDAEWTTGAGSGAGAITWTYTLTDDAPPNDPIPDANVWVTSDIGGSIVIASGTTDQYGVATFYLDAGTVYVWRQKTGWDFTNPDTEVVS